MKLNTSTLSKVNKEISIPMYNRQKLESGIIHIGVGGFHRSHQAYYIHQLLVKHTITDWAITGIGIREADRKIANALKNQDGLYSLVTQHPNGTIDSEVIGSIKDYILAIDTPQLAIDKMADANTKIVSLTITEGGYNFNPTTGLFNFENPDIQHELAHPNEPKTIYGYLTAALLKRRKKGLPPFTIMSCDNIQHNGDMTRKMVLAFAKKQDLELSNWIEKEVRFPNTMVDRITPITTPEITKYLKNKYDLEDEFPVACEPFIQWVVEDNFSNGRPPLEKVGVQFVPDVTPYEKMKIRLLNAGHSVLGIPGALHGHRTIDACIADPIFLRLMRQFMDKEATPILGNIEGIDIEKYKDSLEERFSNPNIKDDVSRICSESSAKLPKFLIPTLRENLENGGSIKYATFVIAAWCFYSDKKHAKNGIPLEIIDNQKEKLHQAAKNTKHTTKAFLNLSEIFGELTENERFTNEYTSMVQKIYKADDIRELIEQLL